MHSFYYSKTVGADKKYLGGDLVTDVFTHGPGVRLFPFARGTFNLSSGIDFAFSKGKEDDEAIVTSGAEGDYRRESVRMESNLNEARLQVFIGNAWEIGRFRLTCDWIGVEKQFAVLAEKSSEDNYTTWEGYHTSKSVDNLSDSRSPFMPVFFRFSTGVAF